MSELIYFLEDDCMLRNGKETISCEELLKLIEKADEQNLCHKFCYTLKRKIYKDKNNIYYIKYYGRNYPVEKDKNDNNVVFMFKNQRLNEY